VPKPFISVSTQQKETGLKNRLTFSKGTKYSMPIYTAGTYFRYQFSLNKWQSRN